ncbi:MAG TPA: Gfo/Idh/MocA family oxidoreductase [Thermoanaerobaculia bacterium]|nr:Gfo/Idh/MocA family oxidoreductase [Thermoanaerobaculia bacterium]
MARIGIIGTGWGARVQVPAFRAAGHEVVAIAGRHSDRTKTVAEKLGVGRAAASWEEIVGADDIDLVTIVTPPSEHRAMAIAALEAGKHVVSEKPTAMNAQEAAEMLAAADRREGQIAIIDHELRFLPSWLAARERRDEIGAIRHAELRYTSPSRGDANRPWNWWSDAAKGGGVLGAIGSHLVDALRYFIGEVVEAQGALATFVRQRPAEEGEMREVTTDDFAVATLRMEGGALAQMTLSVVAGVDEPTTLTFHGEKGAMRLTGEILSMAPPGGEWREVFRGEAKEMPGNSPGGPFGSGTLHLARALERAIDRGDLEALAPAATFFDGLQQQRILDAIRSSHSAGGAWTSVRKSEE